jgi:hypothetical protein
MRIRRRLRQAHRVRMLAPAAAEVNWAALGEAMRAEREAASITAGEYTPESELYLAGDDHSGASNEEGFMMRFQGTLRRDGKFWLAEVPVFDAMTQGRAHKEALAMLAVARLQN